MSQRIDADLFPAFLKRAAALWTTVVLPAALLAAVNVFCFWLVWGEMKAPAQRAYAVALTLTALAPGLAGLAALAWARRKPGGLAAWAQIALGALGVLHLVAYCCFVDDALPRDTPDWAVGPTFLLAQFACLMPAVFLALWRVAGVRLRFSPLADFGFSALAMFLPPAVLYAMVAVASAVARLADCKAADWLFRPLVFALLVAGPLIFFLALLRCLLLARRFFAQRGQSVRAYQMGYVGCVALVLPIAGLLLNKLIPFPADFQNPWPYALTVANALVLMLPATGVRVVDEAARLARVALFPFTFYFFVVFLPFLPLSIMAILAMGSGFLILAPTLLFMVHGQLLKRDYEEARAAGAGRLVLWARTALLLLAMPLAFALRTEADRGVLREVLHYRLNVATGYPDYKLAASPAQVRRVLLNVRRFKDGAEIPYLASWYNWRVFDSMLLRDEKVDELWRLIVGGEPPEPGKEDFTRNMFASLFGGRTRSPEREWGGGARRPVPRNVALADIQTTSSTTNGETETRVTLTITSHDRAEQAEYRTQIQAPPGVWVSGLRLKIGGRWADGRVFERKAAEWVYRQIRDVSRRDPAILRYEEDGTLSLRVFPVAPGETREVEIAFLCPDGLADAVTVGGRRVALGGAPARPLCAWADGVFVRNAGWAPPAEALVTSEPAGHLVLDCSAKAEWTEKAVSDALRRAQEALGLPLQDVALANYERRTITAKRDEPLDAGRIRARMLPARGAFDAVSVLSWLASESQASGFCDVRPFRTLEPRVVMAGPSVRESLAAVTANEWRLILHRWPLLNEVLVLDGDGALSTFPVPGAQRRGRQAVLLQSGVEHRLCVGDEAESQIFTRGDDGLSLSLISPACERRAAVPGLAVLPPGSRWVAGARAWRLWREWELYPHPSRSAVRRDSLAASDGSGVLTPGGAYIVVENSTQWKMLAVKQRETLAGDQAFDLVESPAPGAWLLVALVLLAWAFRHFRLACRCGDRLF